MIMYPIVYLKRFFSKMLPKGMYQIARNEFQKCNILVLQGGTSTLRHLPVHASAESGAGAPLWSLPLQHSPSRGKAVLDLPLFVICTFMLGLIKYKIQPT